MANLQDRLDAAFGALGGGGGAAAPAWRPAARQVFRAGAAADGGNSSDEEYEERARRESMPGLAASLVEEDQPDAEGFRPSTAFCRALDAEEEYNDVDEVATGLLARRAGADALPPRSLEVLDDNPYERRSRAEEQTAAAGLGGAAAQQPAGMDVEEPEAAPRAAPAAAAEEGGGGKRKVRFAAGAEGYVPPSRRPGYEPRCTELPPEAGAPRGPAQRRQQRGAGLSRVPDHVANPQKYTCYVLEEPLVVGGGVGQLGSAARNVRQAAGGEEQAQEEPERWEGPVGVAGAVQFRSRQQRAGAEGAAPAAAPAAGGAAGAPARREGAPQLQAYDDEAAAAEEGDAAMEDAAAAPAAPAGRAKNKRSIRRSRAAEDGDEDA